MKQNILDNVIIKEERQSNGISYTYELILREGVRTDDWRLPLYSIKITMTDSDGRQSRKEATDVFTDQRKAKDFFEKLVRNLATPIDLGYVVEDEVRS